MTPNRATLRDVPFVGMTFVTCESCGRKVRLWTASLSLPENGKLPDDAAVGDEDGTFECPFCSIRQSSRNEHSAWAVVPE